MKSIFKMSVLVLCLTIPMFVLADVPVVDATPSPLNVTDNGDAASQQQYVSTDAQGGQVAQQVSYLEQQNLPGKISQLQQTIQDLQGIVEEQGHQIQQLQQQQRNFYSDFDARISKLEGTQTTTSASQQVTAPTTNSNATAQMQDTSSSIEETQTYQSAFSLIQNKKYSDAIDALNDYLKKYPDGKYVVNVHYWLGEIYAISGKSDLATGEFNNVVTNFPTSNKAPDAMFQLGSMAYDQSNWDQAKQWWQKIVSQFPQSNATQMANQRLQQLHREGH